MVLDIRKETVSAPPHLVYLKTDLVVRLEQMPRQLQGGYSLKVAIGGKETEKIVVEPWDVVLEELENKTEEELMGFVKELVKKIKGG